MIPVTNIGDVQIWTLHRSGDVDVQQIGGARATGRGNVKRSLYAALAVVAPGRYDQRADTPLAVAVEHSLPEPFIAWQHDDTPMTPRARLLWQCVMADVFADAGRDRVQQASGE